MTESDAQRRADEALRTARARAGDNEGAVQVELEAMMHRDEQLHKALAVLGLAHLRELQKPRH
ncbi:hypothetical protein BN2476_350257 [Paraburkholderia piptadeniae]|uniref:Uncharacterized protein n=1 Tax=Paraburkholderia piptadeniae TaxID=1701573 RepID=A0A1N7S8S7_9BURK|nr:hypothetical protein [Paraburkholderia piptadeniae]SIT43721.1 hypothetical protein BN2476_350257 [Paraburkholderia piptadeniae]